MSEQTDLERKVYRALITLGNGTVLGVCRECRLFAADVVNALDGLTARGWVQRVGEIYFPTPPDKDQPMSVDQVIDLALSQLKQE